MYITQLKLLPLSIKLVYDVLKTQKYWEVENSFICGIYLDRDIKLIILWYMIPVIPPTPTKVRTTSETFNMPVSPHLDSAVREGGFWLFNLRYQICTNFLGHESLIMLGLCLLCPVNANVSSSDLQKVSFTSLHCFKCQCCEHRCC